MVVMDKVAVVAIADTEDGEVQGEKRNIVGFMDSQDTTEENVIVWTKDTKLTQPLKTAWTVVTEGAQHDNAG